MPVLMGSVRAIAAAANEGAGREGEAPEKETALLYVGLPRK